MPSAVLPMMMIRTVNHMLKKLTKKKNPLEKGASSSKFNYRIQIKLNSQFKNLFHLYNCLLVESIEGFF